MEAVNIRVGRHDDLVVAQVVDVFFDAEGHHHIIELFVFVDGGAGFAKKVLRHALEGEDGLGLRVARGDDRAGGRLPLGEEDRRFLAALLVAFVILAVLELGDLDLDAASGLLSLLLNGIEFLAQLFVVGDARFELLRGLAVFMEEIDDGLAGLVDDPAANVGIAQLVFGLRLENRLLDP